jgi:hypothetical protein
LQIFPISTTRVYLSQCKKLLIPQFVKQAKKSALLQLYTFFYIRCHHRAQGTQDPLAFTSQVLELQVCCHHACLTHLFLNVGGKRFFSVSVALDSGVSGNVRVSFQSKRTRSMVWIDEDQY